MKPFLLQMRWKYSRFLYEHLRLAWKLLVRLTGGHMQPLGIAIFAASGIGDAAMAVSRVGALRGLRANIGTQQFVAGGAIKHGDVVVLNPATGCVEANKAWM